MDWKRNFANLTRLFLVCCLAFLAFGIQADETESGHAQAFTPMHGGSPGLAGMTPGGAIPTKPTGSNVPAYSDFEQPPQKVDIFQLQKFQQMAAQNLERSQPRVVLPPDALAPRPEFDPASTGGHDESQPPPAPNRFQPSKGFNRLCICILLGGIGILASRKLLPLIKG